MKPRTEDEARNHARRQAARAYIEANGPLPPQPPLESRTCAHAGSSRPCSCHLTLEQIAVAEELGDYTLYVFGVAYTGRIKVPFYPGASAGDATQVAIRERHEAQQARATGVVGSSFDEYLEEVLDDGLTGTAPESPVAAYERTWRGHRRARQVPVAPLASSPEQDHVAAAPAKPSSDTPRPRQFALGAELTRPKRAFDPVYNAAYAKARRRGPEAVAAFKAEWAARKAAA